MWGLRKPELRAPAQKMLDAARAARTPESERELFYISALEAAIHGRVTECVSHVEVIARAHPHDLLALRLAQFELFWIGEAAWMRDISERAAPAWSKSDKRLGIYDERLRDMTSPLMEAVPDFFVDIQNDVALLQRLEFRGVDVGGRWSDIGELCAERIGNHTSPFTSAHSVLGLAAAGRFGEANELISAMNDFVATDRGSLGPRVTRWPHFRQRKLPSRTAGANTKRFSIFWCRRGASCGRWAAATRSAICSSSFWRIQRTA